MDERSPHSALRVAGAYLVFGVAWILLTDAAASRIAADVSQLFLFQVAKGVLFVLASAAVIWGLVRRERRQWEAAEREREGTRDLLVSVVEGTSDGIFVKDLSGRILFANSAAARMLGREDPDDVIGHRDEEFLDADALEMVRDVDRLAVEEDRVVREEESLGIREVEDRAYDVVVAPLASVPGYETTAVLGVARDVTEQRRAERELRSSNRLLDAVVEGTGDSVYVKDPAGRYLLVNSAAAERIGRPVDEIVGRTDHELFGPEAARQFRRDDVRVMQTGTTLTRTEEAPAPDGGTRVFDTHKAPLRDGDEIVGVIGVSRDITERKRAQAALEKIEAKYETLFQAAPLGISLSTLDGSRFLEVNRGFQELTGYTREELLGRRALAMDLWVDPADRRRLQKGVRHRGERAVVDARLRRKDGEVIEARIHGETLEVDGTEHLLAVSQDISELRQYERELERRALRDELTGLANRTLFRDRLSHALDAAGRHGDRVAVLFADLDRFKVVNDSLGHPAGDELLEQVGLRLRRSFREEDTVARLGGDEFGVILERVGSLDEVEAGARRLVEEFEQPFRLTDDEIHQDASVGIAVSSDGLSHADEMIRFADIAMYRAKEQQGSDYHLFDPDVDAEEGHRLQRENELRTALEEEQLVVHYQPVVRLETGAVVGGEALVRWEHPERGLLSPAEFIPLAEETGLIVPLGDWITRTAARHALDWSTPGSPDEGLHLGINYSGRQLQEPDAVDRVKEALADSGISPDRVILEITESVAIGNREAIQELREHGLRVAVDDIGTGYASLEYLTRLDVDIMKVDRLFVAGIGEDVRDEAIVEAAVHIAHRLDTTVVAEGIETDPQLRRLRALGYDYGQGYFFAQPRPREAFGRLLAENPTWPPDEDDGPPAETVPWSLP